MSTLDDAKNYVDLPKRMQDDDALRFARAVISLYEINDRLKGAETPRLTIEGVRIRVQEIRDAAHDFERAHVLEDRLLVDFAREIATGVSTGVARELAVEVLKSRDVDFQRVTA